MTRSLSASGSGGEQLTQLLEDLAAAGFRVDSLADLRESGRRYKAAVPVLLRWLPLVADKSLKSEIVRALSVPWARPAATGPLIDEFRRVDPEVDPTGLGLRWTIGNALEVVGDDSKFTELVELVQDPSFGRAREMVVLGLGRLKRPEVVDVLIGLLGDAEVSGHAVKALGKLKATKARPALERMLNDRRAWVRREAKKALARLSA